VAGVVLAKMAEWGWQPAVTEVGDGRPNIVVTVDGGGGPGPTLGFEGHMDVVTEGDLATWTHHPYGAEIVDGRLYGRGSADMKAGVAAMLYATRALQESGPFPGSIRLFVCSDEEGMMLGAKDLVGRGAHEGVDGVVICEPEGFEVCPTSKGGIRLRVELTGKMSHGAMPTQGRNPIPVLGRVLAALETLQSELQEAHGVHEHLGATYVTPTVVLAGEAVQMNSVPAVAEIWIDVRTIPGVDHAELIARVREDCTSLGGPAGVSASVEVIDDRPPVDTPVEDPVVTSVVAAHIDVFGETPAYGGVPGTTDGTILTVYGGVPTVVYGPGGKWIAHQVDEWVAVEEIRQYTRAYAEVARRFLSRTVA
jgi:succinyl-diaminopimelate desuccinylase